MKKIITTIVAIFFAATTTFAQTNATTKKAQANAAKAMETIEEFQKLLATDYNQLMDAGQAVSGKTFKMGECMALTVYGDDAMKKQAETYEAEFGKQFSNSTWVFEPDNTANMPTVTVTATNGQAATSGYSGSGAMFRIGTLIESLDIAAYIYQNKKNKTDHMIFFQVANGMMLGAAFNIANNKTALQKLTTDKELVKPKTETTAVAPIITKTNAIINTKTKPKKEDIKNKAKNLFKSKL